MKSLLIFLLALALLGLDMPTATKPSQYSFIVAGHTYGHHDSTNLGLHPPFVRKLKEELKDEKFLILTGDVTRNSVAESWAQVEKELAEFGLPYYISAGNHDKSDFANSLFSKKWGGSWYKFRQENDLFIVLDTEQANWAITPEQVQFLRSSLGSNNGNRVFIFMHSLLWVNHSPLEKAKYDNWGHHYLTNQFWAELFPVLRCYPGTIYVIAGDVGGNLGVVSASYQKIANVHLIASGMGHTDDENFLRISVSKEKVDIMMVPLNDQMASQEITRYDINNFEKK